MYKKTTDENYEYVKNITDKLLDMTYNNDNWEYVQNECLKYLEDENYDIVQLAIIPNLTRNGRSNGFIENVITDEKYRKKGIGKKIIEMAIKHGKQNNCYKIILQSSFKRKENHIFYEKCGFDGDSKRAFEIRF
jgi:GNAT superfamily N-acetyltransferase